MLDVASASTSPTTCPLRLCGLTGYGGRVNDVVYYHPLDHTLSENQNLVIYFGGDVQDFTENMEGSEENKNYSKWSLENTAFVLHSCFPDSHVMVVRPSRSTSPKLTTFMDYVTADMHPERIEFKTFSCFDNFVPSNGSGGAPEHTPTHGALQHLERLIQALMQRIQNVATSSLNDAAMEEEENNEEENSHEDTENKDRNQDCPDLNKAELKIIGFSKGCVVLNQLLYEFHYLKTLTPDDDTMMKLVSRIRDMYWLDGGHSGGKNTWITSRSLLETLSRLDIRVNVHVTPYQVQDDRRPWIRKEEHVFTETLKRLGVQVNRQLHFETKAPNLYTHFEVLNAVFERCDNL